MLIEQRNNFCINCHTVKQLPVIKLQTNDQSELKYNNGIVVKSFSRLSLIGAKKIKFSPIPILTDGRTLEL